MRRLKTVYPFLSSLQAQSFANKNHLNLNAARKKANRDKRRKSLVKSELIAVLSIPIYLETAAYFKQYVARAPDCLGVEKTRKGGKKDEICLKTSISHPW